MYKVCIFSGSSFKVDKIYLQAASEVGRILAQESVHINYGGGAVGLMGALASSVLEHKGKITSIIPAFMVELGWSNTRVTETIITHDMRERKKLLIEGVDGVIALPGGIGTLEELTEVITLKQLGRFDKPIVILNTKGFYKNLLSFLDEMIELQFMSETNKKMWTVVNTPEEILPVIKNNHSKFNFL